MTLLDEPLRAQAAAIARGEADPAELLEATLERIEQRNGALNAIVAPCPDEARGMLASAPEGPLRGVPVAVKDEFALPWRAPRFGANAPEMVTTPAGESGVYRALRDAGAVIVGVTNMHEFGLGSTGHLSAYGPACNPWDTTRCPGGSSSGSAAAVAGGMVAGAVGADGAGSIRLPSAYCGLTGLKPTFGRVSLEGNVAPHSTMTVGGPICADAADCRLMAGALFGAELTAGQAAGLRVGRPAGPVWEDCQTEVAAACELALEQLVQHTGGSVVEVQIEGLEHAGIAAALQLAAEESPGFTPELVANGSAGLTPILRALLKYQFVLPATLLGRAQVLRTMLRRSLSSVFGRVDVLAWPTVPAVAPPLAEPEVELPSGRYAADTANVRSSGLANLAGIPGINIPAGFDRDGLPIGLMLQAAWGRDELLLDAAEAFELASGRRHVEAAAPLAATG